MSDKKARGVWMVGAIGLGGAAIAWCWVFFGGGYPSDLHRAADVGTALGPIATFATAVALIIGFESLRLQRASLDGQQKEIDETLRQMARAAVAQEDLAAAMRDASAASLLDSQLRMLTNLEVDAAKEASHWSQGDRGMFQHHSANAADYRTLRVNVLIAMETLLKKHPAVEQIVVPLARTFHEERKRKS